jgi:hypothetical protein
VKELDMLIHCHSTISQCGDYISSRKSTAQSTYMSITSSVALSLVLLIFSKYNQQKNHPGDSEIRTVASLAALFHAASSP